MANAVVGTASHSVVVGTTGAGGTSSMGGAAGVGGAGGTDNSSASSTGINAQLTGVGGASSSQGASDATAATSSGGTAGQSGFVEPTLLSETGLFSDVQSETLAPGVLDFTPNFSLWSDGATKRRWVYLPPDSKIDSYASVDYWSYPVGTKLWKEFTRDGVRVETRLLQKVADEEWFMVAFQWNDEETDAFAVPEGQVNARQTEHDIPDSEACVGCHGNVPDNVLGFSALQLSHDGAGVTLDWLIEEQRFNAPPSGSLVVPGNDTERAALGYLHANCGHCHNDGGSSEAFSAVDLVLWLRADELTEPATTSSYTTTINQDTQAASGISGVRVVPGDPENSILYQRFTSDDPDVHMPSLGTEVIDPSGLMLIEDWILALE